MGLAAQHTVRMPNKDNTLQIKPIWESGNPWDVISYLLEMYVSQKCYVVYQIKCPAHIRALTPCGDLSGHQESTKLLEQEILKRTRGHLWVKLKCTL